MTSDPPAPAGANSPQQTLAIDVHAHFGDYVRGQNRQIDAFCSGDVAEVIRRARVARTRCTIASPLEALMPRGAANAVAGNAAALEQVRDQEEMRLWVVAHPLQPETFAQVADFLQHPCCVGIKIHPEEHQYPIQEQGESLFALAAEHRAIVLAHTGDPFSWPADFLPFADAHPEVRLILAHLGNGGSAAGDPSLQVRAVEASRHGNVYVDTSSARSLLPGLIEWAVETLGDERILYGTDTPLYSAAMQRARIDSADISDHSKRRILCQNAEALFGWSDDSSHSDAFRDSNLPQDAGASSQE